MNYKFIMASAFVLALTTSCSEDRMEVTTPTAAKGDDVEFSIASRSRTMYQDDWDATDAQSIYWGNYINTQEDKIKIYCKAASNPIAEYVVNPTTTGNSNVAESVVKVGEKGIQWGPETSTHNFYAFYPASAAGGEFLNGTDNTIRATVDPGQSPLSYKAITAGGNQYTDLKGVLGNNKSDKNDQTTIYGEPDMAAAIMVAKTKISDAQWGQMVPLNFQVLADVLDITINGPVTPNTLNGNEAQASRDYINIQTVTVEPIDASGNIDDTKKISGTFDLDMENGTVTNIDGNSSVQLQLSQIVDGTQIFPTLYIRVNTETPSVDDIDHLRLRAFLIPGQITNLNQLRIRIMTDCGEYIQNLGDNDMVSGKIHPVKLGYFHVRGAEFDFAHWIGQLDPNIYISELSIPGTWHSSNSNNQGSASLADQYNAGIRAFEVHTLGGTIPYTDVNFQTQLTPDNASTMDYYDEHMNENTENPKTEVSGGTQSDDSWWLHTLTNATVTQTRTTTYQQMPKVALRLYRTRNVTSATSNPSESFSDALVFLAETMNKEGLMFFEFGYECPYARNVTVPCRTVTITETRTKTGQTLKGNGSGSNIAWETSGVFSEDDQWTSSEPEVTYTGLMTLTTAQAWVVAVESCLARLAATDNKTTGKKVLYTTPVTANTTIRDVQGQVIVKINTNDTNNNENEGFGWSGNTPALFSRWMSGSGAQPLTVNLQWGKPVAPYGDGTTEPTTELRWCYTELEGVSNNSVLQGRKNAIDAMNALAYQNYQGGLHRTFYECAIGGYYINNNVSGCQNLAKELNPYLLTAISKPDRMPCPLGLVFMNYAIPPTGEGDTYKSADLIRAIINNNAAFMLNRASGSSATPSSNVQDNTNSSFSNSKNGLSPLK